MEAEKNKKEPMVPFKEMLQNFLIEMVVYGVLLLIYFYVALRFLAEPLSRVFNSNLLAYAVIGLGLIVTQAVVLEFVTSFLFDFLGVHRLSSSSKNH